MPQPTNAQLAAQLAQLILLGNQRDAQFREWLTGAANGGPSGDGRYPLIDASGKWYLIACPAKLADLVAGPAALSEAARSAAQAAQGAAEGSAQSAYASAARAASAQSAAAADRALARQYRDDAASYAANLSGLSSRFENNGLALDDLTVAGRNLLAELDALKAQLAQ